jgi:hypothetical protein
MSEVKVNKISPRTNCGTVQLGDSGDTITIPAGATITNNGTQTGFGRTGTVDWQTGSIKTTGFTAVSGEGYFCDTNTSGAFAVTLPASPSAGDIVAVADYANSFDTANLTLGRNGSNIEGDASDLVLNQEGAAITVVYVDGTKGWIVVNAGNSTSGFGENFIIATGGTETESGDCKIHVFNSPGTFTVNSIATRAANNEVSYVIVGGGGGGGMGQTNSGGGGGAGGYRESKSPITPYTASPLDGRPNAPNRITVTATSFPITVGSGGAGHALPTPGCQGSSGGVSTFSTVTSAGGGGGGSQSSPTNGNGANGGSGGGSAFDGSGSTGGTGNTPPVTPPQGNPGGNNTLPGGGQASSGGGGAGAAASPVPQCAPTPQRGSAGGAGVTSSITASPVARAGGGGSNMSDDTGNPGGTGGGGPGGSNGTDNTGGGGGGGSKNPANASGSGNGGSGVVIIRYKFQN